MTATIKQYMEEMKKNEILHLTEVTKPYREFCEKCDTPFYSTELHQDVVDTLNEYYGNDVSYSCNCKMINHDKKMTKAKMKLDLLQKMGEFNAQNKTLWKWEREYQGYKSPHEICLEND